MLSKLFSSFETTLLLSVTALYIVHCPFNKVEESFNTQAVHDVINLFPQRLPSNDYLILNQSETSSQLEIASRSRLLWDHVLFPGVVPRTFVGSLLIGLPMKLASILLSSGQPYDNSTSINGDEYETEFTSQLILQIGSRFALSSLVALSLSQVAEAVEKKFSLQFRLCFVIASVSQFHYLFYAGRFIPNTFAAILANLVFASWLNRKYSKSLIFMALCVVIFRFDSSLFFVCLLFDALIIKRHLRLSHVLKVGIPAGLLSLAITLVVDSLFWSRLVWPEFDSLYFNVWLNKSHEYGTQDYMWYITSCIPRILMASGPMMFLADHKVTRDYLLPSLAFIFLYSILPHKELRFILFITPLLNICVTSGLMNLHFYLGRLFNNKTFIIRSLFALVMIGMVSSNLFGSFVLVRVASHNYPGGQAAVSLGTTRELLDKARKSLIKTESELDDPRSDVGVYVNNLAAQTGMSRFLQVDGVYYSKTPKFDANSFKKPYDLLYLIFEPREMPALLKEYCPAERNRNKLLEQSIDKWKRNNDELRCQLPNQPEMYCSIHDSMNIFKSVNFGGLLRRLKQVDSWKKLLDSLDDSGFINTRTALHIIRCGTRSKFNPFD